jgi:predicted nucleotidyltransferase
MGKNILKKSFGKTVQKFIRSHIFDIQPVCQSIKAVYLFGSVLLDPNKFKTASDIDIAFLVDNNMYKKDPLSATSSSYFLATQIGLKFDRQTDVTILNSASLETAYQVIVTGEMIYEYDNNLRIEYEIALKGLYFDFKPFLNTLRSQHISRLKGNTHTL